MLQRDAATSSRNAEQSFLLVRPLDLKNSFPLPARLFWTSVVRDISTSYETTLVHLRSVSLISHNLEERADWFSFIILFSWRKYECTRKR
jgi:hypothetical protein